MLLINRFRFLVVNTLLVAGLQLSAQADPPNQSVLDGVPNEYDGGDLIGANATGLTWGPGNVITNLFITWDSSNLYVALQGWEEGNKLGVFLDVDPDQGTGTTRTRDWYTSIDPVNPRPPGTYNYIQFQAASWEASSNGTAFGLDYMLATDGIANRILRCTYDDIETNSSVIISNVVAIFDHENGLAPQGTPIDMVVRPTTYGNSTPACRLLAFEGKIPWTDVYDSSGRFGTVLPGHTVPTGATIRVLGHLFNNNPDAWSSPQTIPEQTSIHASYNSGNGRIVTADYIDLTIDANADGLPDVAPGDVNAPFITKAEGATGDAIVHLTYNEDLANNAALTDPSNYLVGGVEAMSVTVFSSNIVDVTASSDLPAAGSVAKVISLNIEDLSGNKKTSEACFTVSAPGILAPVEVTFVIETASGMGTGLQYFVNSPAFPLEEGMPPSTIAPMTNIGGTVYSLVVNFPAETPNPLQYRHSATYMGTNTYEVVTLDKFETARHQVELNDFSIPVVVTNWLGAAGPPLRTGGPGTPGWIDLYNDSARGDSGVRARTEILFQLDLRIRDVTGVSRLLVLGTDPLRGFNNDNTASTALDDLPPSPFGLTWSNGGVELFDDGSNGDMTAFDGIFSRLWAATTDGADSTIVPVFPNSLVGGGGSTPPYSGFGWTDGRTPRLITYKFYAATSSTSAYEQVAGDNILYISPDEDGSTIALNPFIWDNPAIPLASAVNPAEIVSVSILTNPHTRVVYENILQAAANNIEVGDLTTETWENYGLRGTGVGGVWTADVEQVSNDDEAYRVVTPGITNQPQTAGLWTWWEPSFLDTNGGAVTVHYSQIDRVLAGDRTVNWFGAIPSSASFGSQAMTFEGDGQWSVNLVYGPTNVNADIQLAEFKLTDGDPPAVFDGDQGNGDNNYRMQWENRATVTPDPIIPGSPVTITYDATGSDIDGGASVNLWYGWPQGENGGWDGAPGLAMSNAGPSNVWTVTIAAPTNPDVRHLEFVFNAMIGTNLTFSGPDQLDNPMNWKVFVEQ